MIGPDLSDEEIIARLHPATINFRSSSPFGFGISDIGYFKHRADSTYEFTGCYQMRLGFPRKLQGVHFIKTKWFLGFLRSSLSSVPSKGYLSVEEFTALFGVDAVKQIELSAKISRFIPYLFMLCWIIMSIFLVISAIVKKHF